MRILLVQDPDGTFHQFDEWLDQLAADSRT